MTGQHERQPRQPRDAAFWARPVEVLKAPSEAPNVDGRRVVGPLQGFGKMWKKTYSVRLEGADAAPSEVIGVWKERFPEFWMPTNRFIVPEGGLAPGGVALINSDIPGSRWFSTGVLVLYADDESFAYMTPEGHPFSGWITFSSYTGDDGVTVAQAQLIIRANDPFYELMMPLGLHRIEDMTWQHTLRALSKHFGAYGPVKTEAVLMDPNRQWSRTSNLRHNAVLRSMFHAVTAPLRGGRRNRSKGVAP